jgi:hypothetical protein
MARVFVAILTLILSGALVLPARAQDPFPGELSLERLGQIKPGEYLAGDSVRFSLVKDDSNYLLRFDNNPEVFVLYTGHASLGGRILKYDSGETVLQVAGWGGMTLYTDSAPMGLPAVRTGDASPPELPVVSLSDMQGAAQDESQHLAYMRGLRFSISADWQALANNPRALGMAFDTLENAVRGIDRFSYSASGREALSRRIETLMVEPSDKPTLAVKARTLVVTFNPDQDFEGRASSRAIARALGKILPKH